MIDRKRILDLLEDGTVNASDSVKLLKALDGATASKDVERVITMLSAGQIKAGDAVDLIDALNLDTPNLGVPKIGTAAEVPSPPAAPKAPTAGTPMRFLEKFSVGRILSIRITTSQAADEKDITLNLPLSLGKFIEKFVPKEALNAVNSQGINLPDLLGSLNADVPKGELINISANAGANEVSVRIEVI